MQDRQAGRQFINLWGFQMPRLWHKITILCWKNILRIFHYPVVWNSYTKREENTYIFPFWKLLGLYKSQVRPKDPILRDTKISDWNLSTCWDKIQKWSLELISDIFLPFIIHITYKQRGGGRGLWQRAWKMTFSNIF